METVTGPSQNWLELGQQKTLIQLSDFRTRCVSDCGEGALGRLQTQLCSNRLNAIKFTLPTDTFIRALSKHHIYDEEKCLNWLRLFFCQLSKNKKTLNRSKSDPRLQSDSLAGGHCTQYKCVHVQPVKTEFSYLVICHRHHRTKKRTQTYTQSGSSIIP